MENLNAILALPGDATLNTVSFPGLGLEFTLNRVAFLIFGHPVYWYGIIITCGLLLAVFVCCRMSKRFGTNTDEIVDLMIFAVPAALIAIRAYYVLFNLDHYRMADGSLDWRAIFRYSDGGLAIYGAVISSILVLLIFCRVKKISFLSFADMGVHGMLIGQLIGRWGNFMNVEAYGGVTSLPWRMCSPKIAVELSAQGLITPEQQMDLLTGALGVHPTFLYESLWNLVGLFLVYRLGKKRKYDGECFLFYLFWYGLGRFWIEGLRTDSLYFFGLTFFGTPIRVSQMLAFLSAAVGGGLLLYNRLFRKHDPARMFVNRRAAAQAAAQAAPAESVSDSAPVSGGSDGGVRTDRAPDDEQEE